MRFLLACALAALLTAGCGGAAAPTPTASPTATLRPSPTATATSTASVTPVPPTPTATATATLTPTPSVTPTPRPTETPTMIPTPSNTPGPALSFMYDNFELIEVPSGVLDALASPQVAFVSVNDREAGGNALTPQPANNRAVLYYASPTGGTRQPVLEMEAGTGGQVYLSASGTSIAYFHQGSSLVTTGLYAVDLVNGIKGRLLETESLAQRGFFNTPSWAPDGRRLAMAVPSGYDMDVYTVGVDGTNPTRVSPSPAYDVWPAWSPDSRHLLFVSDRAVCASWRPGDPGTCDAPDAAPPTGGNLYVYNLADGTTRQLSREWITEPPRWLNANEIVYASGDPLFGDAERALYLVDIRTGTPRKLTAITGPDDPVKISEAWSPDGRVVLFQGAGTRTEIVMMTAEGMTLGRTPDYTFPRYGMRAAWSPDGTRVAIGGADGQCPYGPLMLSSSFEVIVAANPPPGMCDPAWSPDGRFLAFTGVVASATGSIDGRVDVFVAGSSGFGGSNLTSTLRGTIDLLGWVGGA